MQAVVTSVQKLTMTQKKQLELLLQTKFNENLSLKNELDQSLLGGFRLKVGSWHYDASLKNKLEQIKDQL